MNTVLTTQDALELIADPSTPEDLFAAAAPILWEASCRDNQLTGNYQEVAMMFGDPRLLSRAAADSLCSALTLYVADQYQWRTRAAEPIEYFLKAPFSESALRDAVAPVQAEWNVTQVRRLSNALAQRAALQMVTKAAAGPNTEAAKVAILLLEGLYTDARAEREEEDRGETAGDIKLRASLSAQLDANLVSAYPAVSPRLLDRSLEEHVRRRTGRTGWEPAKYAGLPGYYSDERAARLLALNEVTVDRLLSTNPELSVAVLWRLFARYSVSAPDRAGKFLGHRKEIREHVVRGKALDAAVGVISRSLDFPEEQNEWLTEDMCRLATEGFRTSKLSLNRQGRAAVVLYRRYGEDFACMALARKEDDVAEAIMEEWRGRPADLKVLEMLLKYSRLKVRKQLLGYVHAGAWYAFTRQNLSTRDEEWRLFYRENVLKPLLEDRAYEVRAIAGRLMMDLGDEDFRGKAVEVMSSADLEGYLKVLPEMDDDTFERIVKRRSFGDSQERAKVLIELARRRDLKLEQYQRLMEMWTVLRSVVAQSIPSTLTGAKDLLIGLIEFDDESTLGTLSTRSCWNEMERAVFLSDRRESVRMKLAKHCAMLTVAELQQLLQDPSVRVRQSLVDNGHWPAYAQSLFSDAVALPTAEA